MSVLVFELKVQHLQLLKHLNWSLNDKKLITSNDVEDDRETPIPFGADSLYEGISLILKGKPEGFNPLKDEAPKELTTEEKAEFDKLYEELPTALDIVLYNGHFELGTYVSRYHIRDWKKQTKLA